MSNPFMGEIRMMSFNFAPKNWALCNGQLLPINQNQALFSLLGTTYGGDGRVNFALPNVQGRVAMHMGQGHILGERGGQDSHTVIMSEMPAHVHQANADSNHANANQTIPTVANAKPGNASPALIYSKGAAGMQAVPMNAQMVTSVGGSQPHENRQPFLCVTYCIALVGIFPSRT